jgi:hypothetical protein
MSSALDDIFAILVLFLLAGGGIIVIDWLIIQRVRRIATRAPDDRSIG